MNSFFFAKVKSDDGLVIGKQVLRLLQRQRLRIGQSQIVGELLFQDIRQLHPFRSNVGKPLAYSLFYVLVALDRSF